MNALKGLQRIDSSSGSVLRSARIAMVCEYKCYEMSNPIKISRGLRGTPNSNRKRSENRITLTIPQGIVHVRREEWESERGDGTEKRDRC